MPKPKPSPEMGRRIEAARIDRGITREALADLVGVKAPAVARWERGTASPSSETREAVARALGVCPIWLRDGADAPTVRSPDFK